LTIDDRVVAPKTPALDWIWTTPPFLEARKPEVPTTVQLKTARRDISGDVLGRQQAYY